MNDEEVKAFQAEALAALKQELAKPAPDPLRRERTAFLIQLIDARRRRRMSQAQLAARLKLHQSTIARIESGRGNPSLNTLLRMVRALGADLMLK